MKQILQTLCVIIVSYGIIYEVIYHADLGLIFITVGSLAFAVSTKINNRKIK